MLGCGSCNIAFDDANTVTSLNAWGVGERAV